MNNPARMDDYCRERGFSGWFETSAKENINIDEASRFLVNKVGYLLWFNAFMNFGGQNWKPDTLGQPHLTFQDDTWEYVSVRPVEVSPSAIFLEGRERPGHSRVPQLVYYNKNKNHWSAV